jgi:Protein of unknown function (DUF3455)
MMCSLLRLTLLPAILSLCAAVSFSQDVPEKLRPAGGEHELFWAHAKGDQIYSCKASGTQYAWTLKAPDAKLFDEKGKNIASHYAGPTWEATDHSSVVGKMAASVPAPDGQSIPWLLVSAASHSGSGVMSEVTSVQRLNTKGGAAPSSECDAAHAGAEFRANYAADYHFFGKASPTK